ncbi:hypothetical protein [Sphingobium yanoikuyae]|uniref:hypothetical protein n=1 Tax=Sphingobium yanoikuyae TaxID=13690 RepID=UPI0028AEBCE0|nr:hypothetical protein [Sphingobium yanoikuyae]
MIAIWLGGDEATAFDIAQMKIENESRLADVSDYTARIVQCENRRLGVKGIDTRVGISSHPRRGWTLDIAQTDTRSPRFPVLNGSFLTPR